MPEKEIPTLPACLFQPNAFIDGEAIDKCIRILTIINTILSISLLKIVIVKRAEFPQILVESSYLCSIKSLEYHD